MTTIKSTDIYPAAPFTQPGAKSGIQAASGAVGADLSARPALFWAALVGLLVLARVLFELAD